MATLLRVLWGSFAAAERAIRLYCPGTERDVGRKAHCSQKPSLGSSFVTLTSHVRQAAVTWPAETDSLTVVRHT